MTEGRKREVRRLLAAVGLPVTRLVRLRVGPITLGGLAPGELATARPRRGPGAPARPSPGGSLWTGPPTGGLGREARSTMTVRAVRGAIKVTEDSPSCVLDATERLRAGACWSATAPQATT